ncbi:hypothetical protein GT042_09065, partial [Streptomyces sp. SID3212]|nr:hypothetical protein [Streptomyces sp. SID3212]
ARALERRAKESARSGADVVYSSNRGQYETGTGRPVPLGARGSAAPSPPRADRPDRTDRTDRAVRLDRTDPLDRLDRSGRAGRQDRRAGADGPTLISEAAQWYQQ